MIEYELPVLEDIISEVVDGMRDTGTITNVVFADGISTITSDNLLRENEVVVIGPLEDKVFNVTLTEFKIEGDATGQTSWKSQSPYFTDGHILDVSNQLLRKDSANKPEKFKKYPLIVLEQDFEMNKVDGPDAGATMKFYIVNPTDGNYTTEQRREFNFKPILDPLYAEFIQALQDAKNLDVVSEEWSVWRRYYWGSQLANSNVFNDRLDAIEIGNFEIETTLNC